MACCLVCLMCMVNSLITTEGVYTKGVVVPNIKPSGRRRAIITFLPFVKEESVKSDEEIWKAMEPAARRIRRRLFRQTYPDLYAESKKKRRI